MLLVLLFQHNTGAALHPKQSTTRQPFHSGYSVQFCLFVYFLQICKSEAPQRIKDVKIPDNWPQGGAITFMDYKMKYRENTPVVLNGLSFFIHAGEKLGIVGRTGSGENNFKIG